MMVTNGYLSVYVRSFFEDYLACQRNLSRNTIQSYRDAMKLFLQFAAAQRKKPAARLLVADIDHRLITGFLEHLEDTRNNSIQTRNHRLVVLRSLFKYISLREPLFLDCSRKILAIPLKRGAELPEIHYLEKEELAALIAAVDRNTPLGRRDYGLLLFMYNTGSRVQETADARISWLSLGKPYKAEILGKGRKWRSCPLWESTVQVLRDLISERKARDGCQDYLFLNRFGEPLSRAGIADIIQRYTARAAATMASLRAKKVTPHTIRHTTAMHLLQSGVEVNVIRSWLGHVNLATTNRYVEIDLEMKTEALRACELPMGRGLPARWRSKPDILTWLESL